MSWHVDHWWWVAVGMLLLTMAGVTLWRKRWALGWVLLAAGLLGMGLGGVSVGRNGVVMVLDYRGAGHEPWRQRGWVKSLAERWLGSFDAVTAVVTEGLTDATEDVWAAPESAAKGLDGLPRWVVTDGMRTIEKADGWTLVPPTGVDAAVRDVKVKKVGNALEVLAEVGWYGGHDEVEIGVTCAGKGGEVARERVGFERSGSRWVSVRAPLPKEACEYVVMVRARGDGWAGNDEGRAWWVPEEAGRVLVWKGDKQPLTEAGWQAVVVEPGTTLGVQELRALEDFVRESGGGLVMEGKVPEALEALSPVWPRREEGGGRNVVLVLDASASMNASTEAGERKFSVLARAVAEACGQLAAGDKVTVVAFNGAARRVLSATRAEVGGALASVRAEGSTVPDAALPIVAEALRGEALEKWVVMVTDGEVEHAALTADKWRSAVGEAEVLVVAPNDGGAIGELVRGVRRGHFVKATEAGQWGPMLRDAFAARVQGRWRAEPLDWKGLGAWEELHGTARGWREVWKKPEAVAWAQGVEGQVVAAVVQRGLGRVAWVGIADEGLRKHAVEAVLAAAGDRRFTVIAARQPGGWRVCAEGSDAGKFLEGERLVVREVGSGREDVMTPCGPGAYEGSVTCAGGLRATVVRRTAAGETLVARLMTSAVATGPWPATVGQPFQPRGGVALPVENHTGSLWKPQGGRQQDLSWGFFGMAALMGVVALWWRH